MILKLVDTENSSAAALAAMRNELVDVGVVAVLVEFRHRNEPASALTLMYFAPLWGNGAVLADDSE